VVFAQQRATGTLNIWSEPYTFTRMPWLFNLKTDPYEKATVTSNTYWDWYLDHVFLLLPAAAEAGQLHHRSGAGETDTAKPVDSVESGAT
jgi:hypothetical protein